ncbi:MULTISPECIES: DUF4259 domain-containing protein [unclassified Streptomyces]|uniref:DUF4259 domain-containing protein n=1 Tax=unclassified Streptomyces TaxID=2593676 RepID=UPI000B886459
MPASLRTLAVGALDQVVCELSELAELWADAANGPKLRQGITCLRDILDPPVPPQWEALTSAVVTWTGQCSDLFPP